MNIIEKTEHVLICTVGLPRSGKSTWCKGMTDTHGYPIVNPDAIRLSLYGRRFWAPGEKQVWAIADTMVRTLFLTGYKTVLLDSTCTTRASRDSWKKRTTGFDTSGEYNDVSWLTLFHEIATPFETCFKRAEKSNQPDLIPIITKMHLNYEPLEYDEFQMGSNSSPSDSIPMDWTTPSDDAEVEISYGDGGTEPSISSPC